MSFRPREGAEGPTKAYLVVLRGAVVGQTYQLDSRTIIGRSSDCDLRIYDESLSRQHLCIFPSPEEPGQFVIQDLDSRNGTWVNGIRITKQVLRDGDRVAIGRALWKFALQDELENQLLSAQRMEAVGSLAAGVAHDFNNLLVVIQGGISLIEAMLEMGPEPVDEELTTTLTDMQSAAERGAGLTKQLLGFARGGSFAQEAVDISKVVDDGVRLIARTFDRKIDIQVVVQPDLRILGDESQIQQMLMNLCLNSRDAMPDGGTLVVTAEQVDLNAEEIAALNADLVPSTHIKFSISDTGYGMDEETRRRAFEPFASTKGVGRGLGLAMVRTIVRGHSGAVTLHSEAGQGSRFDIYLPALTMGDVEPRTSPSGRPEQRSGLVLVVDDDAPVRKATSVLVRQLGFEVIEASGGPEALAVYYVRAKEITLVLLDMVMPEMTGRETFEKLRAIDANAKVLLCSGYDDGQAKEIQDKHRVEFLQKPYTLGRLSGAIDRTLK